MLFNVHRYDIKKHNTAHHQEHTVYYALYLYHIMYHTISSKRAHGKLQYGTVTYCTVISRKMQLEITSPRTI